MAVSSDQQHTEPEGRRGVIASSAFFFSEICKVPIWASSIGPSRHALLAGGLLGHGTSGEIVAASSRLGPIELELFGGGIRPARVQRGVPGESPAAET